VVIRPIIALRGALATRNYCPDSSDLRVRNLQWTDYDRWNVLLSTDAVRLHGICYGDVAVCESVTLMYCAQSRSSCDLNQIVAQPL